MFNKLKPGESEEDVLRMAAEFNAERQKNPNFQPAATVVRVEKPVGKSLFAQKRELNKLNNKSSLSDVKSNTEQQNVREATVDAGKQKFLLDEIHENMLGDIRGTKINHNLIDNVLGEIVERKEGGIRPPIEFQQPKQESGKSLFARKFMAKESAGNTNSPPKPPAIDNPSETTAGYSAIVQDPKLTQEIHAENLNLLNQMREEDILAEQQKLLNSLDPALIKLLAQKREKQKNRLATPKTPKVELIEPQELPTSSNEALSEDNPAQQLLQQSDEGNWLNFNLIEEHKLAWMRDIPAKMAQLKPGEQFNARFDWKGVLLPHNTEEMPQNVDERELYLHGEEPDRPGYSLQELFRLARSTVLQQRISAFGSIAGILSIYNQGFYDQVLSLPVSKIFFLLRFGLDDNAPAQLEVVSRALARLFYNETDEVLLDHIYENAYCHWQPTLQVLVDNDESGDSTSFAFLQRYMALLRTNSKAFNADVEEETDTRLSMDDFQLAETDLMSCLLRTNILQRICFILRSVKPENSTVESCLKVLIRIARTNVQTAKQVVEEHDLINVILTNFLPQITPASATSTLFYGQPQYLALKLIRVLICQHLDIAKQLATETFIESLKHFLFYRDDIKGKLIRVQIEALRIVRCLLLLGVLDRDLFKQLLPALRQMLDWHYNHCVFDVGGPALIRQHAAALLVAIVASGESGVCDIEAQKLLLEPLHNCCCSWTHRATRANALKDYTQLTLLSAVLYAVNWFARHGYLGATSFRQFLHNILPDFVRSAGFIACVQQLTRGSIILRRFSDRRNSHAPLPNVGAVLMHDLGPQLVVSDTYPVQLLSNLWAFVETPLEDGQKQLLQALMQPAVLEPLGEYLKELSQHLNRFLASNFFARSELKLVHQLLSTDGIETYLTNTQLLQLVYSYLCCLSTAQARQMKSIFERYIFSDKYVQLDEKSLELLQTSCMEIVYTHFIADNKEPNLTLCYTQAPVLPSDWPYFQLRLILNNYLQNVQQHPAVIYSENQVVRMTLTFVEQLEQQGLQIVSPLEKLMYLMISFMGPDSQFLDPELHKLLHGQLLQFYAQNATHTFNFEATHEDKGNFEPLYYLFVNHFEAASYGDELFSSLVLLPLAQKYDNKWRRRIWSEHVQAMRFLNCDESLLIGGLAAYLEPVEQEPSLVQLYGDALQQKLVRPGSIAHKIARHHFNNSTAIKKTTSF
ncbi:RNA polymerase II-associated protein 1 [Drosophila sulfurigaster albostrigata]|uniref:RNA polymerase II-associated protein 1 n=1 Tax=Drosophila sulfurigaster albostrigata TaxID=89887 RepID=UPI002D21B1F2|nr:RNA polymerase II-associated protein 1 [Drosophila sulfurigaster albostrigata]